MHVSLPTGFCSNFDTFTLFYNIVGKSSILLFQAKIAIILVDYFDSTGKLDF